MSKKRVKQYLMLLTVIGLVSIASGSGTFATFSAETTNAGNTFTSGTLFLHNTDGTTLCTSETALTGPNFNYNPGDGTNGNSCAVLFNGVDLTGLNVAGQTAHLTLSNAGTIPASDIKFDVSSCSVGVANAGGSSVVFGTAPTCGQMYVTVQETQSNFTTNVYCAFPDLAVACNAPSSAHTLANTNSLTALNTTGGIGATFTASGGGTDTRYYVIKVTPGGVTNDNQLQNRKITFALTWHIDQ